MDAFQQVFMGMPDSGVEDKNGYHAGKLMKIVSKVKTPPALEHKGGDSEF